MCMVRWELLVHFDNVCVCVCVCLCVCVWVCVCVGDSGREGGIGRGAHCLAFGTALLGDGLAGCFGDGGQVVLLLLCWACLLLLLLLLLSTHSILESRTKLRSSRRFCSKPSLNIQARQMDVH